MEGLIGQGVRDALESLDHTVLGCDLRSLCETKKFDLRNADKLRSALAECDGVLHLGALSRVIWGEMHPALCHSINVGGVITLTKVISEMPRKIWLIFASSREIYGTPSKLPCTSDMSPHPENLYAHTKMVGENMVWDMRCRGFCVAVIRLSNVFGTANDYHDRVVPAFAKAAAHGGVLHIRGADSALDFTPLEDAVNAIVRVVQLIDGGVFDLPAIDIVTRPCHLTGGTCPNCIGTRRRQYCQRGKPFFLSGEISRRSSSGKRISGVDSENISGKCGRTVGV